jgi:hypothetical protein
MAEAPARRPQSTLGLLTTISMKRIRERRLAVRFLFFALVAGLCLAAKATLPDPSTTPAAEDPIASPRRVGPPPAEGSQDRASG